MSRICCILLAHLPPAKIDFLIRRWNAYGVEASELLLCYGGSQTDFERITHEQKIFIADPRLRTRNHQRERQSYRQIFRRVAAWLEGRPEFTHIYLAEFDHWPVVKDLGARLLERMEEERADVLGHELGRRDETTCVHYLNHASDERFLSWLKKISVRGEKGVVLNMFGSGSFWTRKAFCAVAGADEPFPIYLEVYLPTVAHHLGFRVRHLADQDRFVSALGARYHEQDVARASGAWTVHPVKEWPDDAR